MPTNGTLDIKQTKLKQEEEEEEEEVSNGE